MTLDSQRSRRRSLPAPVMLVTYVALYALAAASALTEPDHLGLMLFSVVVLVSPLILVPYIIVRAGKGPPESRPSTDPHLERKLQKARRTTGGASILLAVVAVASAVAGAPGLTWFFGVFGLLTMALWWANR